MLKEWKIAIIRSSNAQKKCSININLKNEISLKAKYPIMILKITLHIF